jgi:hypothetical protein
MPHPDRIVPRARVFRLGTEPRDDDLSLDSTPAERWEMLMVLSARMWDLQARPAAVIDRGRLPVTVVKCAGLTTGSNSCSLCSTVEVACCRSLAARRWLRTNAQPGEGRIGEISRRLVSPTELFVDAATQPPRHGFHLLAPPARPPRQPGCSRDEQANAQCGQRRERRHVRCA